MLGHIERAIMARRQESVRDSGSDKHALIVSLKYAPGLTKEFCLIGSNLRRHGYRVRYLLSAKYAWQIENGHISDVVFLSRSLVCQILSSFITPRKQCLIGICDDAWATAASSVICFYNFHPLNVALARWSGEVHSGSIRSIYLHEPKKIDKQMFSLRTRLIFGAVELLQALCMRWTNHVIVPSPNALNVFQNYYASYHGEVHLAPILLPDDADIQDAPRQHVTMVGRAFRDGRMQSFWKLVEFSAENQGDIRFRIVTSSNIAEDVRGLSQAARATLDVVNPSQLSDQEINRQIASSLAVLSMHTQGTQSGVTPVAFMNRTPIIARDIPMFNQSVRHGYNGYLVPEDASSEDWVEAIHFVQNNLRELSSNARATFEEVFHERNWERYYEWMFESTQSCGCLSKD
jgi:glycosyltransferase involved in cell wall biosynthesis